MSSRSNHRYTSDEDNNDLTCVEYNLKNELE